ALYVSRCIAVHSAEISKSSRASRLNLNDKIDATEDPQKSEKPVEINYGDPKLRLSQAIKDGDRNEVQKVISDVDFSSAEAHAFNFLGVALWNNQVEIFKDLIEHNESLIDVLDQWGNTLLHNAVRYENVEIVKFLLSKKKSLIDVQNKDGETAL